MQFRVNRPTWLFFPVASWRCVNSWEEWTLPTSLLLQPPVWRGSWGWRGGGGSSRWASYQTRLRNFLGCPQPRALRNTKILRTALGLLQQGRAFRFKRRKWQDLFRARTPSSQNLITARMRIIFIRELFTFRREGRRRVLQQIRCLSETLVCPHCFLTVTYHVNRVARGLSKNQRCFKAASAMVPVKATPSPSVPP